MASDGEHIEVGNVCVSCGELWPCRVKLTAERDAALTTVAVLREALEWYVEVAGDTSKARAALAAAGGEAQP